MELKSLLNKIIEGGRLILTQPTMLFIDKEEIGIMNEHYVTELESGRPDLICLDYYGTEDMLDYLLKFNGISDPFSINEGDLLKIPHRGDSNFKKLERPQDEEQNVVRQEFLDTKRMTPKDQKRIAFLKKKYGVKEVLPPNVLKSGQKTYKFTDEGTIMGMEAMTPETTFSKKLKESTSNKEIAEAVNVLPEDIKSLFNKNIEDLTISEVTKLNSGGVNISDFDSIKDGLNNTGGENQSSSTTTQVFDESGNLVGNESTVKSIVYEANKKTTTITKTITKNDGTVETTQTSQTSAAGDTSNNINIIAKSTDTYNPPKPNLENNTSESNTDSLSDDVSWRNNDSESKE